VTLVRADTYASTVSSTLHPFHALSVPVVDSYSRNVMDRDEVSELHYITPIENVASILDRGILSHNRAARHTHRSVALEDVQDRRRGKRVPGGSTLHSYANLYFDARNPMMYYLKERADDLVVLRVSEAVLDLSDAIVTDGNAAAGATRFYPLPDGLERLDSRLIYATYWNDEDYWRKREKKRARCAEVLVPNVVPSSYIKSCYVDTRRKRFDCLEYEGLDTVVVRKELYFR
jgi:ssDNA thymidine ADP-ribosyltransferase, DarT